MANANFVLRALRILGLEEMLKLSEVLHEKQVPLKKAAGEELIAWDAAVSPKKSPKPNRSAEAKILPFIKKKLNELEPLQEEVPEGALNDSEEEADVLSSDLLLWQRGVSRQSEVNVLKQQAVKGYQKASEMYVVKETDLTGKEKIRFAATNGVLINKKQA